MGLQEYTSNVKNRLFSNTQPTKIPEFNVFFSIFAYFWSFVVNLEERGGKISDFDFINRPDCIKLILIIWII